MCRGGTLVNQGQNNRSRAETDATSRRSSSSRSTVFSESLVGQRFAQFDVLGVAGRGGMGLVFRAHDTANDAVVALKMIPAMTREDREPIRRFLREARVLARLDHPSIPRIHAMGRRDHLYYLATDFVTGRTLAQAIDGGTRFTPRRALEIVRDVAGGLDTAHRHGIVHRDVKSDNIMLDDSECVKVLDFGIAQDVNARRRLTMCDLYLGTPEYCSPEQLAAECTDGRTDVYSLGVVLHELLTGTMPFGGTSTVALYNQKLRDRRPRLRILMPGAPRPLRRLVRRMLAANPERRYGTMSEVIDAVDAVIPKLGAFGWGQSSPGRFRRRRTGVQQVAATAARSASSLLF